MCQPVRSCQPVLCNGIVSLISTVSQDLSLNFSSALHRAIGSVLGPEVTLPSTRLPTFLPAATSQEVSKVLTKPNST